MCFSDNAFDLSYKRIESSAQEIAPMGQKCIKVSYREASHQILVNSLNIQGGTNRLRYNFNLATTLGLNFTFRKFLLTDICLPKSRTEKNGIALLYGVKTKCTSYEGTEYVTIGNLYFCYKRPEWSVFAKHKFEFTYHLCDNCINEISHIVFDYQVQDEGLYTTHRDEFNNVLFYRPNEKFEALFQDLFYSHFDKGRFFLSLFKTNQCVRTFLLKGTLYQRISVEKSSSFSGYVYLLDVQSLNRKTTELKHQKIIDFHFCFLEAEESWKSEQCDLCFRASFNICDGPDKYISFKFLSMLTAKQKMKHSHRRHFSYNQTCTQQPGCRTFFNVFSHTTSSVVVTLHSLSFSGWQTYSCFYGGLTVFEKPSFQETLKMCSHLDSNSTTNPQNNSLQYASMESELLVVVYHLFADSITFEMTVSDGKCKAHLLDVCHFDSQNRNPTTVSALHQSIPQESLQYFFPTQDTTVQCWIFQIGGTYFKEKFNQNYHQYMFKYACHAIYGLQHTLEESWCGASLRLVFFSQHYPPKTIVHKKDKTQLVISSILKNSTLTPDKQKPQKCFEDFTDISQLSQTSANSVLKRSAKTFTFGLQRNSEPLQIEVSFSLKHAVSPKGTKATSINVIKDHLAMHVAGLSESMAMLRYELLTCEGTSQMSPPSQSLSLAGVYEICLRESIAGLVPPNSILRLALENNMFSSVYKLGRIASVSNLCLSADHVFQLPFEVFIPLIMKHYVRLCFPAQDNKGEDQLVWTADLWTDKFQAFPRGVFVELPGKITNVKLSITKRNASKHEVKLRAQWAHRKLEDIKLHTERSTYFYFDSLLSLLKQTLWLKYFDAQFSSGPQDWDKAGYTIAREGIYSGAPRNNRFCPCTLTFCLFSTESSWQGYQEPRDGKTDNSWYYAKSVCKDQARHLPILHSFSNVEEVLHFVRVASFTRLIKTFFIGVKMFYSKVRPTELQKQLTSPKIV